MSIGYESEHSKLDYDIYSTLSKELTFQTKFQTHDFLDVIFSSLPRCNQSNNENKITKTSTNRTSQYDETCLTIKCYCILEIPQQQTQMI